ncbi:hypothetical protein BTA51_19060 [Hahella sp. CCB-MM4]|uniref:hypothetical protein n=1 Tax=Hahella sp. (strain CCB-MM4) TaxID=1926491 RepID=UPI000B9C6B40|nr:hypothetical protein [Hahella sp. CCB-MM4]OZG71742.1 hypothetical protein BTA51_19060 [Hahella sp. CCB-MM4]
MYKFLRLIAAALLCLQLISCASEQSPESEQPSEQKEGVTISPQDVCRHFPEHVDCKDQPASEDDDDMKRLR